MNFEINNNELLYNNGEDCTVLVTFLDIDILKDPKYNLYLYVEIVNNRLLVKFGEAFKQTVFDRYNQTGCTQSVRTVCVWETNKHDKPIHAILKQKAQNLRGYIHDNTNALNTDEAYEILSVEGYTNFINDLQSLIEVEGQVNKEDRQDYPAVISLVDEIVNSNKKRITLDLCARWGKTGTWLRTIKQYKEKEDVSLHIMSAYVGTVKHSYSEEICKIKANENCKFIDPDIYETTENVEEDIKNWLSSDTNHYVVYYLALTGDEETCFDRRYQPIANLNMDYTIAVEEADFGSACKKQVSKLNKLIKKDNCKHSIVMTGTKIDKTEKIFEADIMFKRDYLVDVLVDLDRSAVGINWYVLDNHRMVEEFGYIPNEMENWNALLDVKDGKFKEETYLIHLINFLFNKTLPVMTSANRKYIKYNLLNDSATMLFMPVGNSEHLVMKELIEKLVPNYLVKIIDGDHTTNAEAENIAREAIKDHGTNTIIIASGMANRSFSVPEIKNVILMFDQADPANIVQKVARGLTPWKDHSDMKCNVIDFRLKYRNPNMSAWLADLADSTLEDTAKHSFDGVLDIVEATDKLTFYEYFSKGDAPFRTILREELRQHMLSGEYAKNKAIKIVCKDLDSVDQPDAKFGVIKEELKLDDLVNDNVEGDSKKAKHVGGVGRFTDSPEEAKKLEEDQRLNYLAYLCNHKDRFNSGKYETDILKNEFKNNMSEARIKAIEAIFKIDMKVMGPDY